MSKLWTGVASGFVVAYGLWAFQRIGVSELTTLRSGQTHAEEAHAGARMLILSSRL